MADTLVPSSAAEGTINTAPAQDGEIDPTLGAEIRRQVEYYFSDENLPHDSHMLEKCGGRKNEPVSIKHICGFKKMRSFKPKRDVVLALRRSAFLEVSEDGKTVKRKVPLQGKCMLDPDFLDDKDVAYHPLARQTLAKPVVPVQSNQQTKSSFPKGTSKNMRKPTGFEQAYAEPPMTPEEAAEGQAMYDMDNPIDERLQLAIQSFKEKRRMHEMYAHVFNKLMRFGGVESSLRVAQGISKQELQGMDKEEKLKVMVTHYVPGDYADETKWAVDFAGLAKSFLSSWYPAHYGYELKVIKNACQVPRSFYNFLRYHNVCPEYDEQLSEALRTCDIAEQELPKVHAAGLALPGDFNKSASALFGGAYAGLYVGDKSWAEDMMKEGINIAQFGIRNEEAKIKFGAGVAIMGSDEQCAWLDSKSLETFESLKLATIEHSSVGLEVIDVQLPSESTKTLYEQQSKLSNHKLGGQLEPLGKLICKTWFADDCDEWDLPKDRYCDGNPHSAKADREYEFWVEESILKECFVGLKIDGRVLMLEGGITILDEVHESMCSFFTWLPNELWMEKKPKAVTWLKKGLPDSDDDDTVVHEGPEGARVQGEGENIGSEEAHGEDDPFDDE